MTNFDICLMNPPYGSVGGDTLHLRFVEKCLSVAKKQIVVMPFTFVTKVNNKPAQKYKEKFDKYLTDVEEFDSKVFTVTNMPNVAIYMFDSNKKDDSIKLIKANKNIETIKSLFDISEFNDYEQEIVSYLEKQGKQEIYWCCGPGARKKEIIGLSNDEKHKLFEKNFEKNIKNIKDFYKIQNGASLIVNDSNGGMNGTFMSSKVGQIFDNFKDIEDFFRNRKPSYNVLMFNSKKGAENCKIALQNPLLRFTCYRTQNDQHMMISRTYRYIPAIDWEDDRVKTDEGLLEVCGCPKDKVKEYADYCKKIIDKVDKGERHIHCINTMITLLIFVIS